MDAYQVAQSGCAWQSRRVHHRFTLILILAFVSHAAPARADGADWEQSIVRVETLFQKGDTTQAQSEIAKTAASVRKQFGEQSAPYAAVLNSSAGLACARGDFEDAKSQYDQAAEIRLKVLGERDPAYAVTINNLGYCRFKAQEFQRAQLDLNRARKLLEQSKDSLLLAQVESNLGELALQTGSAPDAEAHFRKALAIRQAALRPKDPLLAVSYNNVAYVLSATGRNDEAIPLYESALAIIEGAPAPDQAAIANALHNLAEACRESGNESRAEALLKRAIGIREKLNGPEWAVSLNSLAELYIAADRVKEAIPLLEKVLTLTTQRYPGNDAMLIPVIENLALAELLADQYAAAESNYRKLIPLSSPPPFRNLALSLAKQRKFPEAEEFYSKQLLYAEKEFGSAGTAVALALVDVANIESIQGKLEESQKHLERARMLLADAKSDVSVERIEILAALGDVYQRRGALSEAKAAFEEAESVAQTAFGAQSSEHEAIRKRRERSLHNNAAPR